MALLGKFFDLSSLGDDQLLGIHENVIEDELSQDADDIVNEVGNEAQATSTTTSTTKSSTSTHQQDEEYKVDSIYNAWAEQKKSPTERNKFNQSAEKFQSGNAPKKRKRRRRKRRKKNRNDNNVISGSICEENIEIKETIPLLFSSMIRKRRDENTAPRDLLPSGHLSCKRSHQQAFASTTQHQENIQTTEQGDDDDTPLIALKRQKKKTSKPTRPHRRDETRKSNNTTLEIANNATRPNNETNQNTSDTKLCQVVVEILDSSDDEECDARGSDKQSERNGDKTNDQCDSKASLDETFAQGVPNDSTTTEIDPEQCVGDSAHNAILLVDDNENEESGVLSVDDSNSVDKEPTKNQTVSKEACSSTRNKTLASMGNGNVRRKMPTCSSNFVILSDECSFRSANEKVTDFPSKDNTEGSTIQPNFILINDSSDEEEDYIMTENTNDNHPNPPPPPPQRKRFKPRPPKRRVRRNRMPMLSKNNVKKVEENNLSIEKQTRKGGGHDAGARNENKPAAPKFCPDVDYNFMKSRNEAIEEQDRLCRQAASRILQREAQGRQLYHNGEGYPTFSKVFDVRLLNRHHWKWTCFYARLGVPKSATESTIKKQYRKLALLYHPDKCRHKDAASKFHAVTEAYQKLMRRLSS